MGEAMLVLGVESSCDESAVALYDGRDGLLSHALYSQVALHREYGGVVPELASRDHIRKLLPLIVHCLDVAGRRRQDIDAVAYTAGPGLVGALLVGANLARGLAWALGIPALPVHHMEAHLMAPMLEEHAPAFPFVALLVSGGHSMLVHVRKLGCYTVLGDSLDDAVGEAFDKTAKLMGLPYPGGPQLSALAERGRAGRFRFPRPMLRKPGCHFSFSGLKTHVLQVYRGLSEVDQQTKADIALAFEEAVVETLMVKSQRALRQAAVSRLVVAGGVSANRRLRQDFLAMQDCEVFFPRPEFSTDNGAMIAYTGWLRLSQGERPGDYRDAVRARWPLQELSEP